MIARGLRRRTPPVVRLLPAPRSGAVPRTGGVESIQEAELTLSRSLVGQLWKPEYLERLARSYWRYLSRISLSLLRVVYAPDSRTVVLVSPRLELLRFHPPDYVTEPALGQVTWRIDRGLLVARDKWGHGHLRITVRRATSASVGEAETIRVEVEVRNFYPWLRGTGLFARAGSWVYRQTQSRLHVLITHGFLRYLGRLDLPPSQVGALRNEIASGPE